MKWVSTELSYAVRTRVIAKYLGLILLFSSVAAFVPLLASLVWGEFFLSARYGAIVVLFLILGLLSLPIQKPKVIQSNEAYVVIALSFLISSFSMIYPMKATGLSFVDLWFECMSGITTTGLSVIDLSQIESKTFFFARAWMQWYGGLGIVVFSLGLAFQPGQISKEFIRQATSQDDMLESSKVFARKILVIYLLLTLLSIGVLWGGGIGLEEALSLSFAAISTGGFAPRPDSLASYTYLIQSLVFLFTFLGAISLPLFWIKRLKDLKKLGKDNQLRALVICILLFTLVFSLLFSSHWLRFLPKGLLNVVSLQTTAGFSTFDFSELNQGSKFLLVASMLIGGSTQSTAGGFKILRLLIIISALRYLFFRTTLSKHAYEKENGGVAASQVNLCFCFFSLYMGVIFISTLLFISLGYDPVDSLFEVVSAIGTVGVSSGLVGADLPDLLKYVLGIDMFFGRLEIVTALVLFYPRTFIGRRLTK